MILKIKLGFFLAKLLLFCCMLIVLLVIDLARYISNLTNTNY